MKRELGAVLLERSPLSERQRLPQDSGDRYFQRRYSGNSHLLAASWLVRGSRQERRLCAEPGSARPGRAGPVAE